jgi:hypothetical protein
MGSFDIARYEIEHRRATRVLEVSLSIDDLDTLTTALWDLAALHKTYPRPHVDRLHRVRRYLLSVQVARDGGVAWHEALPAPPSEST